MVLLAFGPFSTKLGGAAWLLLVVLGLMSRWGQDPRLGSLNAGAELARQWVLWCVVALGLRLVAHVYWGDAWNLRHFDVRMLLGGLATWWLMTYLPRPTIQLNAFIVAMVVAAGAGLAMVFLHVQFDLPTPSNRINWTLGLAFMCCLLLGLSFTEDLSRRQNIWIWVGIALHLVAIFLSGTRAAYFVFPWVLGVGSYLLWKHPRVWSKAPVRNLSLIALGLGCGFYLGMQLSDHPMSPFQRINKGIEEVQLLLNPSIGQVSASETSMGARIGLWMHGIDLIESSPWWGYGLDQRIAEVKALGERLDSHHILSILSHFHSEYINNWVEHGIWGLSSTLVYVVGLLLLAWRTLSINTASGIALLGIALHHATASFTNLNSRHNYYGVMLTTCILLALYLIPTSSQRTSHEPADNA
jgi:O-antigen ligase